MRRRFVPGLLLLLLPAAAMAMEPWAGESGGVIGRVFYDNDDDGLWSSGDEGLGGARIVTDSGEVVVTGADGRYHLFRLAVGYETLGSRLIKLDMSSLPSGARVDTPRALVQLTPMGTVRVDFVVSPPVTGIPESRGIAPAERDVPPRLEPDASGLKLRTVLAGKAHPGCLVFVEGQRAEVGDNRVYQAPVTIQPGVNPFLVTMHCDDGHLEFLLSEIHWVSRKTGGDLIVPAVPRTLATCSGPPPGYIARTENVDMGCRLQAGLELKVGAQESPSKKEEVRSFRVRLKVKPGLNTFPVKAYFGEATRLTGAITWDVSEIRLTGAVLGSLLWRVAGNEKPTYLGKLRGVLRADFPWDLKLILGGGVDTSDTKKVLEDGTETTKSLSEILHDTFVPAFNPWVHQRDPDPDEGYLVAGDSAVVSDDIPNSSRYFLRVRRKSSFLGWGGFETHDGVSSEIGTYRRALLGAHGVVHPFQDLFPGPEPAFDLALEGFYAPEDPNGETLTSLRYALPEGSQPAPAHEELLATGGTLYFLHHSRVVEGSERLQVHKRDARTGLTLERRVLRRSVDYQMDWMTGRILLFAPLDTGLLTERAVRFSPAGSTATILVADYEHWDTEETGSPSTAGGRAAVTVRPSKGVAVSGTFTSISRWAQTDYRLYKGEAGVRFGKSGAVWASYASSQGSVLVPAYSVDGGLSFGTYNLENLQKGSGEAYQAGARIDLKFLQGQVLYRRLLEGYRDTGFLAFRDLSQGLASLSVKPSHSLDIVGRFSGTQQNSDRLLEGSLGVRVRILDDLVLSAEGAFDQGDDQGDGGNFGEGHRALAGLRVSYRVVHWLTLVAGHQHTVLRDGEGFSSRDLTLSSIGGELRLFDRYQVGLEGGWGPEVGNLVRLSLREDREGGGAVFGHTTFSLDGDAVRAGSLSTGQAVPVGGGTLLTTSQTFAVERGQSARGQQVGLQVPLSDPWFLNLSYQRSELHNAGNRLLRQDIFFSPFFDRFMWNLSRPGRRNAVHARLSYLTGPLALSASGEYRVDERLDLANAAVLEERYRDLSTHQQAVFTLGGRWVAARGLVLGGRVAWAETVGADPDVEDPGVITEGRFLEASLGAAYRPPQLDWIRILLRTSLGEDTRPPRRLGVDDPYTERWLSGSLAVLLRPTQYFQPTLVVAPWLIEFLKPPGEQNRSSERTALMVMIRIGSEIYAGLGVAGELRFGAGAVSDVFPEDVGLTGFHLGAAAEVFYLLEGPDIGGLRLSIGYSFSDLPDPMTDTLSANEGVFLRLEGML